MPTSLSKEIFDLLGVFFGPWSKKTTNVANGTNDSEDMVFDFLSGGNIFGNGGSDRITLNTLLGVATTVNGGPDSDQIYGSDSILSLGETLNGDKGNDWIEGRGGADTLSGGEGIDTLSYESSNAAVTINLAPKTDGTITLASGGHASGDVVKADFENVVGSAFNDTITGNSGNNILIGLAGDDSLYGKIGDDILVGGAGADLLDGGNGFDTADYSTSIGPVWLVANASGGWYGLSGDAQDDTLVSIEKIIGSKGNDVIDGSASTGALQFEGGGGDDIIIGGAGDDVFVVGPGINNLDGRGGNNRFVFTDKTFEGASTNLGMIDGNGENVFDFSKLTSGIEITISEPTIMPFEVSDALQAPPTTTVSLKPASVSLPFSYLIDPYRYNVYSGPVLAAATFNGNSEDNIFRGGADNDTLNGGGGNDTLLGGDGDDTFDFNAVSDSRANRDETKLDRIEDFRHREDKIDLSGIDAIEGGADDKFTFLEDGESFTALGQIHIVDSGTPGYVKLEANVSGSLAPDFSVLVKVQNPAVAWSAADFGL